ncbi:hypothetical protein [Spiroplasma sp. SV19]|uniref:hypothetical protein n=1 Tax=Spiroplasma sp. SV19 TaxID=2570468 RepID=UPI0024B85AA5|nr:hypothetical protein [Spiroplasma sp. SV19]WHQ37347.1 hypothetical protein E7Y35_05700 [Spiroplasma sp. SV19]
MTKFKTTRTTVRFCLQKLLNQGIIYAKKGSGYYLNSFYYFNKIGLKDTNILVTYYKIVEVNIEKDILNDILNTLNINPEEINFDDYIGYVKILFNKSNKAMGYFKSFLLKTCFDKIDFKAIEISLMNFIRKNNIMLSHSPNVITIENADNNDHKYLSKNIEKVVVINSVIFDKNNLIIEIVEKHIDCDYFQSSHIKFY